MYLEGSGVEAAAPRLRIGAFVVDSDAGTVAPAGGGRTRHLSPQAVATLLRLAQQAGIVVAREAILRSWPANLERSDEALTHAIHALREAFADDARHSRYIRTAKNVGYVLISQAIAEGAQARVPPHVELDHSRFLYRVAVLYWGAAWVVLQLVTLIFDFDSREKVTLVGGMMLFFLVALVVAWWLQRNAYLTGILEWLLRLIPQSAAALLVATAIVGGLLFLVFRSLASEGASARTVRVTPPAIAAARYSVAVLPFVYEGGDASYAYLADGLPEELIAVLSRLTEIQVVSRTSSFYYKGRDVDLRTIAQQLQVAHLVEGRVGMEQGQLRVTVTLVNAPSGRAVWSHTYRQRLNSVFELYDGVMARVAQELALEISPDLHASLAPMRTGDEEAYALYLQGREELQHQTDERFERAHDLFDAALDRDPRFARAFAGLCDTYLAQYRRSRDNALIAPATEACNRALDLDPAADEVQIALAKLRTEIGDFDGADAALKAAFARNPRSYDAQLRLGELRWGQQRLDEAEAAFRTALELQPGNWQGYAYYGAFLLEARADHRGAEDQFNKVLSLTPDSTIALSNLGAAYMYEGRLDEAGATYEKLLGLDPNGQTLSNLGLTYYYVGRYADAVSVLERAAALAPSDHRVWGNLAIAQSYAQPDSAGASASYRRAIELGTERLAVDPEDADALSDLATYHAAIGDEKTALEEIARAAALLPHDDSVHYYAAIVHELLGDRETALSEVGAAIAAGYPRSFIEGDARLSALTHSDAYRKSLASPAQAASP